MVASGSDQVRSDGQDSNSGFGSKFAQPRLQGRVTVCSADENRILHGVEKVPSQRVHIDNRDDICRVHIGATGEGKRPQKHFLLSVKRRKRDGALSALPGSAQLTRSLQQRRYPGSIIGRPRIDIAFFVSAEVIVMGRDQDDLFVRSRTRKDADDILAQPE